MSVDKIKQADFSLSISRYKQVKHSEVECEDPETLLESILKIENEIVRDATTLQEMLSQKKNSDSRSS